MRIPEGNNVEFVGNIHDIIKEIKKLEVYVPQIRVDTIPIQPRREKEFEIIVRIVDQRGKKYKYISKFTGEKIEFVQQDEKNIDNEHIYAFSHIFSSEEKKLEFRIGKITGIKTIENKG